MSVERLKEAAELHRAGNFSAAEAIYREVLAQNPDSADGLQLLGTLIWQRDSNADEAIALLRRALEIAPKIAPAHHNLGGVYAAEGRFDEAVASFRRAIELKPDYAEAFYNLSSAHRIEADDGFIEAAEALAAKEDLNEADRRFLAFALGKAYDDIGDRDRAFAAYARGNALKFNGFDPAPWTALIDEIDRLIDADFYRQRKGWGVPDTRPVFVIGMPRSGTTLVEQILSRHPQIAGVGEREDLPAIERTLRERIRKRGGRIDGMAVYLPQVVREEAAGFANAYLQRVGADTPDGTLRMVDKLPHNFFRLALIALMFPRAKVIHMRREAMDTCLSCFFQNFTVGHPWSYDLTATGTFYRLYERIVGALARHSPLAITDVRYEDLVSDPEAETRRLIDFCGLAWDPACLGDGPTTRTIRTASAWQARQPVYRSSVAKWRRYEAHLEPLRAALQGDLPEPAQVDA